NPSPLKHSQPSSRPSSPGFSGRQRHCCLLPSSPPSSPQSSGRQRHRRRLVLSTATLPLRLRWPLEPRIAVGRIADMVLCCG
ncbi:hypothetical protein HN873_052198, partial [Arachis hypogaea]